MPCCAAGGVARAAARLLAAFLAAELWSGSALGAGPTVRLTMEGWGAWSFEPGSPPAQVTVPGSSPLRFAWEADPGAVSAYRFGWDLQYPTDGGEWEQDWCATCQAAPERSFLTGEHRFYLDARNAGGELTTVRVVVRVVRVDVHELSWTEAKTRYRR